MSKIAIVTLYDDINIGNKLQNYAVQIFFEKFGMKCETLRHWEMAYDKRNWKKIKLILIRILGYPRESSRMLRLEKKRKKRFKAFSDAYLKLGPVVKMKHLPENLSEVYDYFVTGSDQVWHNWTGKRTEIDYFFLQFAKEHQRLTIAASFGKNEIEKEFLEDYDRGIKGIPIITCREQQGASLIKEIFEREVEVLLDPTMLIDEIYWYEIEKKPKIKVPEKYILIYALGNKSKEVQQFIEQVALENDMEIVDIYNKNIPELYMTAPDEFLYFIHHAHLVVTDSFHASVFSILFHTDFVVFDRMTKSMGNMSSRLDTLLNVFGLSDRKFGLIEKKMLFQTDFSDVNETLKKERRRAVDIYNDVWVKLKEIQLQ